MSIGLLGTSRSGTSEIWSMSDQYKLSRNKSWLGQKIKFIGETTDQFSAASSLTIPLPTGTRVGDLVIAMFAADGSGPSISSISGSDWTSFGNTVGAEYPSMYMWGKIMTSSDISTGNVTGTPSSAVNMTGMLSCFRIYGRNYFSLISSDNDEGPATMVTQLLSSSSDGASMSIGVLTGRLNQAPTMYAPLSFNVIADVGGGQRTLMYQIYDEVVQPIGVDLDFYSNDTGRQSLMNLYLKIGYDYEVKYGTPQYTITTIPSTGTGVQNDYDSVIAVDANFTSTTAGVIFDLGGSTVGFSAGVKNGILRTRAYYGGTASFGDAASASLEIDISDYIGVNTTFYFVADKSLYNLSVYAQKKAKGSLYKLKHLGTAESDGTTSSTYGSNVKGYGQVNNTIIDLDGATTGYENTISPSTTISEIRCYTENASLDVSNFTSLV